MQKGSERLKALVSPRVSQEDIAKALDVSQQAVSAWITGRSKPSDKRRESLQRLYGIPIESWDEPKAEAVGDDAA